MSKLSEQYAKNILDIKPLWVEAYLSNNTDPHAVFAELLGVSRTEAKHECYKFVWNNPFLRGLIGERL